MSKQTVSCTAMWKEGIVWATVFKDGITLPKGEPTATERKVWTIDYTGQVIALRRAHHELILDSTAASLTISRRCSRSTYCSPFSSLLCSLQDVRDGAFVVLTILSGAFVVLTVLVFPSLIAGHGESGP
jgi:hypothetical protein